MSTQTYSWPRNNNIKIFQKDTLTNIREGIAYRSFYSSLIIKSLSRWNIAPISWIYLWVAMEAFSQRTCMLPSNGASPCHCSSVYTGSGCTEQAPCSCVSAYLVLCPPCGDLLAYMHTSFIQRNKTTMKNKTVALNGRGVHYLSWHSFSSPSGMWVLTVSHCLSNINSEDG